jgi:hypothetical protein
MGKRDAKTEHHDAFSNFSVFSFFYCLFCFKNKYKASLNDQNNPSLSKPPLSECLFFFDIFFAMSFNIIHGASGLQAGGDGPTLGGPGWAQGMSPPPFFPPLCFLFHSGSQ